MKSIVLLDRYADARLTDWHHWLHLKI